MRGKNRWNIMWGDRKIGSAAISLNCFGTSISDVVIYHTGWMSATEIIALLNSRFIPATRYNYRIFDAIMQVDPVSRGTSCYGFMQTATYFTYCHALTDPLWISPRKKFTFRMDRTMPSAMRSRRIEPADYDTVSFRVNGFDPDIGHILFYNPTRDIPFETGISYRSPDLTTGGDKNKQWVEKDGTFWLQKRMEWLCEDELANEIKVRESHYFELEKLGYAVPEIRQIPCGWETSCICEEGGCLLSEEQIKRIYHIYNIYDAAEYLAKKLGVERPKMLKKKGEAASGLLIHQDGSLQPAFW